MKRCHRSIGRAILYTTVTITIGFSILVLSNFIPTIYFGIFTGFAMLVALTADITLLPKLLIMLKPLGPEGRLDQS
jgi:predicted RND superfamily exporter protein